MNDFNEVRVFLQNAVQELEMWRGGNTSPSCFMAEETVETVSDVIFGVSQITADGDCSHEIKRRLLLRRTVMTNLDSIVKSRDITLPSQSYRFSSGHVWM